MEKIINPEKFWKDFAEADLLKREEMIKVIVDNLDGLNEIEDERGRIEIKTI